MSFRPWPVPVAPGGPPTTNSARNEQLLACFLMMGVRQPGALERSSLMAALPHAGSGSHLPASAGTSHGSLLCNQFMPLLPSPCRVLGPQETPCASPDPVCTQCDTEWPLPVPHFTAPSLQQSGWIVLGFLELVQMSELLFCSSSSLKSCPRSSGSVPGPQSHTVYLDWHHVRPGHMFPATQTFAFWRQTCIHSII